MGDVTRRERNNDWDVLGHWKHGLDEAKAYILQPTSWFNGTEEWLEDEKMRWRLRAERVKNVSGLIEDAEAFAASKGEKAWNKTKGLSEEAWEAAKAKSADLTDLAKAEAVKLEHEIQDASANAAQKVREDITAVGDDLKKAANVRLEADWEEIFENAKERVSNISSHLGELPGTDIEWHPGELFANTSINVPEWQRPRINAPDLSAPEFHLNAPHIPSLEALHGLSSEWENLGSTLRAQLEGDWRVSIRGSQLRMAMGLDMVEALIGAVYLFPAFWMIWVGRTPVFIPYTRVGLSTYMSIQAIILICLLCPPYLSIQLLPLYAMWLLWSSYRKERCEKVWYYLGSFALCQTCVVIYEVLSGVQATGWMTTLISGFILSYLINFLSYILEVILTSWVALSSLSVVLRLYHIPSFAPNLCQIWNLWLRPPHIFAESTSVFQLFITLSILVLFTASGMLRDWADAHK